MKRIVVMVIMTIIQPLLNAADEPSPILTIRLLTAEIVQTMVSSAVADCDRRGYRVSAAVVDRNGNLAAFLRHPLAGPHTVEVSQRKAYSSATLQTATSNMSHRPDLNFAPNILLIVGGVPIKFVGHFYGGMAVAGAPPNVDEQCALAGIAAVSDILDFAD